MSQSLRQAADPLVGHRQANIPIHDISTIVNPTTSDVKSIPVFYNLFVSNESEVTRVRALVDEQLSLLRSDVHHPVYVNAIGHPLPIPGTELLQQYSEGSELVTLRSVWDYCANHTDEKVIYMHAKGVFTNTPENARLRRFLTEGVLSDECRNLPDSCDVCSSRFSPLPHPHTSGNMWLARCSYVNRLANPNRIRLKMRYIGWSRLPSGEAERPWCSGRQRFADEHWIHSHPSGRFCDLHAKEDYVWGSEGLLTMGPLIKDLQPAPRFNMSVYLQGELNATMTQLCKPGRGRTLEERLLEYWRLYRVKQPSPDWWGWKFYPSLPQQSIPSLSAVDLEKRNKRRKKGKELVQYKSNSN